jgi:hypothetical protein
MRLDILLQFIVPLSFLAIWALTSLLNRDANPLPPRPVRSPNPGGSRIGSMGPGRSDVMTPARYQVAGRSPLSGAPLERASAGRPTGGPAVPGRPVSGRLSGLDEGILILDSNARVLSSSSPISTSTSPALANSRSSRGSTSRRAARSRSAGGAASLKPVEPERPRALTGLVTESLAQKKTKRLEITPLSAPLTPMVSAPLTQTSAAPTADGAGPAAPSPALTGADLRTLLSSSNRRRELVLLAELLQPPVALRPRRRIS